MMLLATAAAVAEETPRVINFSYIVAAILFILGIKLLKSQATARMGNLLSALGMALAIVATLFYSGLNYPLIVAGLAIGSLIGVYLAVRVKMTSMPELIAIFDGLAGLVSLLVAWAEFNSLGTTWGSTIAIPGIVAVFVGASAFSASLVAYAKLAEHITGKPIIYPWQKTINAVLAVAIIVGCIVFSIDPTMQGAYGVLIAVGVVSFVLGVLYVLPIGGADMPVVISFLNSYSGVAISATGFVVENTVLVVAGALIGASGFVLTKIMCKAMNRSFANVLFGGVGAGDGGSGESLQGEPKAISTEDTFFLLEAARSVIIVPGYGMAVAQAQHVVKELAELLEHNGAEVKFAIHAVAGRMPGHMNVLLAEADVPYEQLAETEDVNPLMPSVDVALVIGANDVVNPAARKDKGSPLYGMPIINADQARTVIVMKRSMNAGFAGVDNPLFIAQNTRMLFGDAKQTLQALVSEFKAAEK